MLFEGRYKTQDYFRYFLHLFSVPSFIFSKNGRRLILAYPQRIVQIVHYLYSKDGFTYGHSIQYKMLLGHLHVYRSIKTYVKPINYLKIVMLPLLASFLKRPTCNLKLSRSILYQPHSAKRGFLCIR